MRHRPVGMDAVGFSSCADAVIDFCAAYTAVDYLPTPVTSLFIPSCPHLLLCLLVFLQFLFSFLTRFIYFLACPFLPILPEYFHSVSIPDVVGCD